MSQANTTVTITPRMAAEAFWDMDSDQQAEFFAHLSDVIGPEHYGHGEMQWCYLSDALNKNPKAKEMACAMTSWVFVKFMESEWK